MFIFFLNQHHNLAKYHSTVFERKFGALFPMPSKLLDLALKCKGRYQKQVSHPAFQTCQRRFLGGVTPHLYCVLFILWMRRDHSSPWAPSQHSASPRPGEDISFSGELAQGRDGAGSRPCPCRSEEHHSYQDHPHSPLRWC